MASSRRQVISPTPEIEPGQSDNLGVSKEFARRDHTHGTPDTSNYVKAATGEKLRPLIADMGDGSYGIDWEVVA